MVPPAVRLVLGFSATVERRVSNVDNEVTRALRDVLKRVTALGSRRKGTADLGMFGVFPIPGSPTVVVGYAWGRAPQSRPDPFRIAPGAPLARAFPFSVASIAGGICEPSVDKGGMVLVSDVLAYPELHEELVADSRSNDFGLRIEPVGNSLDPNRPRIVPFSPPVSFALISDDGRPGAIVRGYVLWKSGDAYQGGRVKTWSFDLGEAEAARIVGIPMLEVSAECPALRVPQALQPPVVDEATLDKEVRDVAYTEKPFGWWLVA